MNTTRLLILASVVWAVLGISGCGEGHEYLAAVQVSPAGGTATAGSAANTVQFTAIGWYAPILSCGIGGCTLADPDKHQSLTSASWKTSDSTNTSVDSKGVATCLSLTLSPATITATGQGGLYGPVSGTGTLVCN